MRYVLVLLCLVGCGQSKHCDGFMGTRGACVVGPVDKGQFDYVFESVIARVSIREPEANFYDDSLERFVGKWDFTVESKDHLDTGDYGDTGWKYAADGDANQLYATIVTESCLASTALSHELLHVLTQFAIGSFEWHARPGYFVLLENTPEQNAASIENQLNKEFCAALCPDSCTWKLF
jgi:hypothetical protein